MGRPWSAFIKAGTAVTASALVLGLDGTMANAATVSAIGCSVFFHGLGVYAIDDYWDREPDRINHPERPIPSGRILPSQARVGALCLFGASTLAAAATASAPFICFMAAHNLVYGDPSGGFEHAPKPIWDLSCPRPNSTSRTSAYTDSLADTDLLPLLSGAYTPICRLSKIGANFSIMYWNVMPYLAAPVALGLTNLADPTAALVPALLMIPPTLCREIVFDWKDREGDGAAGLRSVATVFGRDAVFNLTHLGLGSWAATIAVLSAQASASIGPADLAHSVLFLGWNAAHLAAFGWFLRQYRLSDSPADYQRWRDLATSMKVANVGMVAASWAVLQG